MSNNPGRSFWRMVFLACTAFAAGLRIAPPRLASWAGRARTAVAMASDSDGPLHETSSNAHRAGKGRGLKIWGRIRRRVQAEDQDSTLLAGVAQDIDAALAARRRRLNAKLGTSLKRFREEVLDEVELQANETKERQQRLRSRQEDIQQSLVALRQDVRCTTTYNPVTNSAQRATAAARDARELATPSRRPRARFCQRWLGWLWSHRL